MSPAVSKKQGRTARMAKAIKEGELPASKFPVAAEMARSMKSADLDKFAHTPEKGLPMHALPTGLKKIRLNRKR